MTYPTISNSLSFDFTTISKGVVDDMVRNHGMHPLQAVQHIDYGVRTDRNTTIRKRDLSTQEILNLFDKEEALCMVYIPHFITQGIMYYLGLLMEYLVKNRIKEFRKHKNILEAMQDEYMAALRHEMPDKVFQRFLDQRDEYIAICRRHLQIMYFTYGNELSKKYGVIKHEPVYCYANIIKSLARYITEHDQRVNKKIATLLKSDVHNISDERVEIIRGVCEDITKPYDIGGSEVQTKMAINTIVNEAIRMIRGMLTE